MQTRIEKYRVYRNEIVNESLLLDKIVSESAIINYYKQRIDAISPKILANLKNIQAYAKLISISNHEHKDLTMMSSYMNLIEDKKLHTFINEIDAWQAKNNVTMSLNSKGQISKKWLETDINYSKYALIKNDLEKVKVAWSDFQITGKENINIFSRLTKNDGSNEILNSIRSIVSYDEAHGSSKKSIYFVICGLNISLLIIFIIVLIIQIVNI